jgi:Tfp pilus assembly protein PilF
MEACRQCHSDKYDSFIHTGMGQSFDRSTTEKSSGSFKSGNIVTDSFRNLSYFPHWKNDSFFLSEFRNIHGDTVYNRTEHISWIIGSGQHTNSHLVNFNGYVYQAPVTFYTQKGIWDLPPGFEGGFNSRFSRPIGLECMSCHNAYPGFVSGSENKYSFVANGIDCERCHGPGSRHVEEMLAGKVKDVNREVDYTIVNPAKLPISLQLDVCQRCHIQGNVVLQEGKSFLDFRPGMKLSDVMNVFMPVFSGDEDSHIMASHAERMKLSKCFLVSLDNADEKNKANPSLRPYKDALTCVTCHDPHVSVKVTGSDIYNDKCNGCHSSKKENVDASVIHLVCNEKKEKRKLESDNCVKCHMVKNNSIDIPHVTVTDHWIKVPMEKKDVEVIKKFTGLACINNSLVNDKIKGAAFLSYFEKFSSNPAFLDSAKRYLSDENADIIRTNIHYLVQWAFLKKDYNKVLEYARVDKMLVKRLNQVSSGNEDAWTCYRIGDSYFTIGNMNDAMVFFEKAVFLAPFKPDFRLKLADALFDMGNYLEAKKNYEFILKENPSFASAFINYGFLILTAEGNANKADSLYTIALQLDPDNIQALLNKAGISLFKGNRKEAVWLLKEVLKRDSMNEKAQMMLSSIG